MAKKLVGTDPDQVPSNADLGTLAYQDADNAVLKNALIRKLTVDAAGTDATGSPYLFTVGDESHGVAIDYLASREHPTKPGGIFSTAGGGSWPFNNYGNILITTRTDYGDTYDIVFGTASANNNPITPLVIKASGNIGVGTSEPADTFSVANKINFSSTGLSGPTSPSYYNSIFIGNTTDYTEFGSNGSSNGVYGGYRFYRRKGDSSDPIYIATMDDRFYSANGIGYGYNFLDGHPKVYHSCWNDNATVTSGRINVATSALEWQPLLMKIQIAQTGNGQQGPASAWYMYRAVVYNGTLSLVTLVDSGGETGYFGISITSNTISTGQVQINITTTGNQNRVIANCEIVSYSGIVSTARTG